MIEEFESELVETENGFLHKPIVAKSKKSLFGKFPKISEFKREEIDRFD